MSIKPSSRPQQSREATEKILLSKGISLSRVSLLGVRGYYRDTMGKPGVNDRGIYDDAIFVYSPNEYQSFNANCDPSIRRYRVANLYEGVWEYKVGIHGLSKPKAKQYTALVQADEVVVERDGVRVPDEGWFGINIHRGGNTTTSSLGCQTIHPEQWAEFLSLVVGQLAEFEQKTIKYVLIDREDL